MDKNLIYTNIKNFSQIISNDQVESKKVELENICCSINGGKGISSKVNQTNFYIRSKIKLFLNYCLSLKTISYLTICPNI